MKTFLEFTQEIDERVISIQTRQKMARAARRNKNKMKLGAKKARKRIKIDNKSIEKKAMKAARKKLIDKRLGGKSIQDLGMGQRVALGKFLDKKTAAISKIAKKLKKTIKQKEMMKKRSKPMDKADNKAIPKR
tara:strand:- start:15 stop:413 length:399 start_codon:yes stop_codon:yes gene_type:complete